MRRSFVVPLVLGLLILGFTVSTVTADEVAVRMETKVVETFDGEGATIHEPQENTEEYPEGTPVVWQLKGSKFATQGFPRMEFAQAFPQGMFGYNVSEERKQELQSLAIHSKFNRKSYNYIEIIPGQVQGGKWEPRGIDLPGKVKTLDLWVWGSNYNYSMEAHLRDPDGRVHVLPLGRLNYKGWKNLEVEIPRQIKQEQQYVPQHMGLTLSKLVIKTEPTERVDNYYVYIDHIKVLTDMQRHLYDGYDLQSPEKMQEIWNNEDSEGGNTDAATE